MNVLTTKKKNCLSAKERHIYMKWDVWDVQRPKRPGRFERPGTFAQAAKPNLTNVPRQTFFI